MERRTYEKMTLKEMEKWECRLTREVSTGHATYPAGMKCSITQKVNKRLRIRGEECPHCGIVPVIFGLYPEDVELVKRSST